MRCEKDTIGSCFSYGEEKVGAVELMDEYWFFHSMFDKRRMFTSSVDVSCSGPSKELVVSDPCEGLFSKTNLLQDDEVSIYNRLRTPSLPAHIGREETAQLKENHGQLSGPNLQRSFRSNGNQQDSSKIEKQSIPRQRSKQESNVVGTDSKDNENNLYTSKQPKCRSRTAYQRKSSKSLSDLEFEELQGFMDLGFTFNKEDMDPTILNMIPGLQDKRRSIDDDQLRRPYLSEAWFVQRFDLPKLNWVDRKSGVDIKEQLRVWARAVASNVRQEY